MMALLRAWLAPIIAAMLLAPALLAPAAMARTLSARPHLANRVIAAPAPAPAPAPTPAPAGTADHVPVPSLPPETDPAKGEPSLAERVLMSPREPRCADDGITGGISVCGKKKDQSLDRLPLPGELAGATATGDGVARAPDVMNNRITGHALSLGCGLGGCPQAMLPDINFRMIPAAPAGSDADLIGRGEIRGN